MWAGAGAAVLTLEVNGIPWETPPPTFTLASAPTPTPFKAATVLAAADAGGGVPAADEVASRLDGLVDAESLGERVGVVVADLASGTTLYDRAGDTAITPASTLKLVTSAAVLRVYGPEHTFRTEVVEGAEDGELILVGGGDPTLSIAERPPLPGATRLEDLADRTAEALVPARRSRTCSPGTASPSTARSPGRTPTPTRSRSRRSSRHPSGTSSSTSSRPVTTTLPRSWHATSP